MICVAAFLVIRYTDFNLNDIGIDLNISDYWRDESADGITSIDELVKITGNATPAKEVSSISADKYAYAQLDEQTRVVYDEVLDAILKHTELIGVDTTNKDVLNLAYEAVLADYGGLFWVEGYTYTEYTRSDEVVGLEFAPKYTMTAEEQQNTQGKIDQAATIFLSGISQESSDYEKARYVYDKLIDEVEYDAKATENQNIISALLYKKTVCRGYACATQYLLNMLGIESVIVTGTANGEAHAWNMVKLDGEYYYLDTTWGNSTYLTESSEQQKFINYTYFAVTTEELLTTHEIDFDIALPECTATQDNYYVMEDRYYTQWNPYEVGDAFESASQEGSSYISVKFASDDLYQEAKKYFITDRHLAYYFSGDENIFYIEDEEQRVITVTIQ